MLSLIIMAISTEPLPKSPVTRGNFFPALPCPENFPCPLRKPIDAPAHFAAGMSKGEKEGSREPVYFNCPAPSRKNNPAAKTSTGLLLPFGVDCNCSTLYRRVLRSALLEVFICTLLSHSCHKGSRLDTTSKARRWNRVCK